MVVNGSAGTVSLVGGEEVFLWEQARDPPAVIPKVAGLHLFPPINNDLLNKKLFPFSSSGSQYTRS